MKYKIDHSENIPDKKGSKQIVELRIKSIVTNEISNILLRVSPVNPNRAIQEAIDQVLGVIKEKGTSLQVRPNDKTPEYQVLAAWICD